MSDREFPANVYPWLRLRESGIDVELVPTTAKGWPDEARLLERLEDPRVRVAGGLAGAVQQRLPGGPRRALRGHAAHGAYLVVDAIQGVGQLPVDLREDAGRRPGVRAQKWLLSPWGSGFVYVRRELIRELSPPVTGWMAFEGTDDFTRLTEYSDTLRADARRFELITLPYQDFAGMNASLGLLRRARRRADRRRTCSACTSRCWRGRRGRGTRWPRRWASMARGSSAWRPRTWAPPFAGSRRPASSAACARGRSG